MYLMDQMLNSVWNPLYNLKGKEQGIYLAYCLMNGTLWHTNNNNNPL